MTTQDDIITRLVEFHDHIQAPATAPALDAMRGERLVRRRRTLSALATSAVLVLTVGIVQAVLPDGQSTLVPAPQPSPSVTTSPSPSLTTSPSPSPASSNSAATSSTSGEWTPERIRAVGSPGDLMLPTESGLAWRQYTLCSAPECWPYSSGEDVHVALEVTQDGRSALFEVRGGTHESFVRDFDEDSVLVQDRIGQGPMRTRLVGADGGAVELQVLDPAPPVPGPGVVIINTAPAYTGADDVFLVDDEAGTLRPLDVPDEENPRMVAGRRRVPLGRLLRLQSLLGDRWHHEEPHARLPSRRPRHRAVHRGLPAGVAPTGTDGRVRDPVLRATRRCPREPRPRYHLAEDRRHRRSVRRRELATAGLTRAKYRKPFRRADPEGLGVVAKLASAVQRTYVKAHRRCVLAPTMGASYRPLWGSRPARIWTSVLMGQRTY